MTDEDFIDRIRLQPRQIRVHCPRGHFIANVHLSVPENMVVMGFAFQRHASARAYWISRHPSSGADSDTVHLACPHRRCGYAGVFDYTRLATTLTREALADRSEFLLPASG